MRTILPFHACVQRMRLRGPRTTPSALLCATLLAPMGFAVEVPSDSTSSASNEKRLERITRFTFAGGGGTYGRTVHDSRSIYLGPDCNGVDTYQQIDADFRFKDKFKDYGGEIDIQATPSFHAGVRGGWINETVSYWGSSLDQATIDTLFAGVALRDSSFTNYYFNPYFALERPKFGFGLGMVYSSKRLWTDKVQEVGEQDDATLYPTGHLRVGRLEHAYLKLSLWEGVPVYSGGGMWVTGFGVRPARPVELFGGYAWGGPFTSGDFLVRANVDLGRYLAIGANYRFETDVEDKFQPRFSESAASVSLSYKLHY